MSQPNRNERLGALTAGIILVVMAAMLLFTRHTGNGPVPQPVPPAVEDAATNDTVAPKKHKAKKGRKPRAKKGKKQHRATRNDGPVRDPLSER